MNKVPGSTESSTCRFEILHWTADIVSAYLNKNETELRQIPQVMETVYAKLSALAAGHGIAPSFPHLALSEAALDPVAVGKSITPDYLICLEDGVRLKTLKRYLFRKYRLTPEQYRNKWGLPADYPMVAPNYAARRSALAKKMGLGQKRRKPARKRRRG
ncbi:MAG TPA: MucR family transcriptional regulator [Rhizomicrobium sp.]|nr:MucR family transcriptional regulator [Rhizomicrobium sp.]